MNFHEPRPQYREARSRDAAPVSRGPRAEPSILSELVAVLAPHPGGLRRWSVMRAIRDNRSRTSRSISLKFENDVERVFRGSCSNCGELSGNPQTALFYRPEGKAGEVWAVHADRVTAWNGEAAPQEG